MRWQSSILYPLFAGGFTLCFSGLLALPRTEFTSLFALYTALFAFFTGLLRYSFNKQLLVFGLCALVSLFFTPQLSDDYYRFLWDGELLTHGINPYDFKPSEVMHSGEIFRELYESMSALSRANYSCYTPGNQFIFALASWPSDSVFIGQLLLRLIFIALLLCTIRPLKHLLETFGYSPRRAGLFILNPLVLTEIVGNLHFEGVMTVCLLLFLYYLLVRKKYLIAMVFLALAVQTKLLPLIILPFLLRYLGWGKSLLAAVIVALINFLFFITLIDAGNLPHFRESLALYFGQFEFNSSLVHWLIEKDLRRLGWLRLRYYAKTLSEWSAIIITGIAVFGGRTSDKQFVTRIFIGLICYFLLSPMVHPWYLTTLIAFGMFTDSVLATVWSYLAFLSYSFYSTQPGISAEVMRTIAYILLFAFALGEFLLYAFKRRSLPAQFFT